MDNLEDMDISMNMQLIIDLYSLDKTLWAPNAYSDIKCEIQNCETQLTVTVHHTFDKPHRFDV